MRFCQRPGRACTLCDVDAKKQQLSFPISGIRTCDICMK